MRRNKGALAVAKNAEASLDLAPIGNGRIAALADAHGRIVWMCFPRFDGDPVFSRLLAGSIEKGFCDVLIADGESARSTYLRNSAILSTTLEDSRGNCVRIVDFCPRFRRFDRIFHPPMLIRRIEPVTGLPRVTIRVRPTFNYGTAPTSTSIGSNHIRYCGGDLTMRLTTDAPLSYIVQESPFALTQPMTLIFAPDEPIDGAIDQTGHTFLDRTQQYWAEWVRALGIPFEWQEPVIRAAITLKLCSFEETGAIVAALTTSVPEAPATTRNWDYRYCWLRDAYFVIKALNQLGATQTMVNYLNYIASLSGAHDAPLKPVYGIIHDQPLPERNAPDLHGYQMFGPVRLGNKAAEQSQHDTYGSIILATSQMFIDERLPTIGNVALFERLEQLGERALKFATVPDAGPWEYRGRQRLHTYSVAMCWVACHRLARIGALLGLDDRSARWREAADKLGATILERAWSDRRKAFTAAFESDDLDASCLLLAELGLVAHDDPRFVSTVDAIGKHLVKNGFVMRYTAPDDFGTPDMAFLACQFWYIDALVKLGRGEHARELFTEVLRRRNQFGILSEDIDPHSGQLWGNLPQTYSMAGIINSAMHLSIPWDAGWAAVTGTRTAR